MGHFLGAVCFYLLHVPPAISLFELYWYRSYIAFIWIHSHCQRGRFQEYILLNAALIGYIHRFRNRRR